MLQITSYYEDGSFRKLKHGKNVFHDALKGVLKGEIKFQVRNPSGEDYSLYYVENYQWAEQKDGNPLNTSRFDYPKYPPYLYYDENDTEKLCFDLFVGIHTVWFEAANEYTVVTAELLLKHTQAKLVFKDKRITLFYPESERLQVSEEEPDLSDAGLLRVLDSFYPSVELQDDHTVDQIFCFHHIFLCQWLTDLPLDTAKYAEIVVAKNEGIGSMMTVYSRYRKYFERYGIRVTLQPGSSRYPDDMLKKYFNLELTPEDSDETNTIYICNYFSAWHARMVGAACWAEYNAASLNPSFRKELEEYAEAVIGNKRMLGVLLRGSDYLLLDVTGASKPVAAKEAIPVIRQWMETDGYDGIVLATEDRDMLRELKDAFGSKLIAIAQERYSIEDFEEVKTIAELERSRRTNQEYIDYLEDTTVNYFYAIYLLSRCESFMFSNLCGGSVLARVFKEGKFRREYSITEGREY